MKAILSWLSRLPTRTWWKKTWGWGYFWWRELWHFGGGTLVGGIAALTYFFLPYAFIPGIFGGLLAVAIVWMETDDQAKGQKRYKTFIDFCAWGLGFIWPLLLV